MSYDVLRASIEERFKSLWSYTPVQYENTLFDPHNRNHVGQFDIGGEWVRLTTNIGESRNVSIESPCLKRVNGVINVQIFINQNTGAGKADFLADNVRSIFENQSFVGVVCRETTVQRIGKSGDWYQVNAVTYFDYDYV